MPIAGGDYNYIHSMYHTAAVYVSLCKSLWRVWDEGSPGTGILGSPSKATCVFTGILIISLCGMDNTRSLLGLVLLVVGLVMIVSNSLLPAVAIHSSLEFAISEGSV